MSRVVEIVVLKVHELVLVLHYCLNRDQEVFTERTCLFSSHERDFYHEILMRRECTSGQDLLLIRVFLWTLWVYYSTAMTMTETFNRWFLTKTDSYNWPKEWVKKRKWVFDDDFLFVYSCPYFLLLLLFDSTPDQTLTLHASSFISREKGLLEGLSCCCRLFSWKACQRSDFSCLSLFDEF